MSPELAAALRPLVLPEGIILDPTSTRSSAVAPLLGDIGAALRVAGRDAAALVLLSEEGPLTFAAPRGAIRGMLREASDVGRAASRRLEARAPRGTWFVAVLDGDGVTIALVTSPGSEISGRGDA